MKSQTVNEQCDAIIAVPRDGGPWQRFQAQNGRAEALLERLKRSGRYKGVFLHFSGPGARHRT